MHDFGLSTVEGEYRSGGESDLQVSQLAKCHHRRLLNSSLDVWENTSRLSIRVAVSFCRYRLQTWWIAGVWTSRQLGIFQLYD